MPCKCTGYRVENCKCRVLRTGYRADETGSVVLLTQSNSLCRLLDLKERVRPNFAMGFIEHFYETCAAYNLRYCHIRGFIKHNKRYFSNAMKDLIILLCFLIANFVVFVTIMTKMLVHLYFVLKITAQWIRRSFTKLDANDVVLPLTPAQLHHDYTPPITNKFL